MNRKKKRESSMIMVPVGLNPCEMGCKASSVGVNKSLKRQRHRVGIAHSLYTRSNPSCLASCPDVRFNKISYRWEKKKKKNTKLLRVCIDCWGQRKKWNGRNSQGQGSLIFIGSGAGNHCWSGIPTIPDFRVWIITAIR